MLYGQTQVKSWARGAAAGDGGCLGGEVVVTGPGGSAPLGAAGGKRTGGGGMSMSGGGRAMDEQRV